MKKIPEIDEIVSSALAEKIFSAASVIVSKKNKRIYEDHFGEASPSTVFDVASLTKPVVTTALAMFTVQKKLFSLDDKVTRFFPQGKSLREVNVGHLLDHTSGLAAWKPFYEKVPADIIGTEDARKMMIDMVLRETPECSAGERYLYSDIDFIVLGAILEKIHGTDLSEQFTENISKSLELKSSFFGGKEKKPKADFASTGFCEFRKRILIGEVNDSNSYVMGGIAGHAGLFSTANDLDIFANEMISAFNGKSSLVEQRVAKKFIDHARAHHFGWDRPSEINSQSGKYFSRKSFGHLAFTGCSVWVDLEAELSIILLTNRLVYSWESHAIKRFRPIFHDAIREKLGV